jgi:hypothetical protein
MQGCTGTLLLLDSFSWITSWYKTERGVPTFEGPEFQPNVIFMKTVGEKGGPSVGVFE